MKMNEYQVIQKYKDVAMRMLQHSYPKLSKNEISDAIDYSLIKRMKDSQAVIDNNYKKKTINISLLEMSEYIISREPIITAYGVMFKKHAEGPNLMSKLLKTFMNGRDIYKKEMFKYSVGSDQFEKYNLLQALAKIDANGFYGAIGASTCIFFNLYVASSITVQGRSLISSASLLFEMFLSNNVQFGSLNEVITFIDNITQEKKNRKYDDKLFIDRDITLEESFYKLMMTCGFYYIPSEEDLLIVWEIMMQLEQEDLNRIFYKNNLYEFVNNEVPSNMVIVLLQTLNRSYLDPNKVPEEISVELDEFWKLLKEYVYYGYQVIDRMDRMDNMIRNVSVINDTDSAIISLDAWYNFIMEKIKDIPLKIKYQNFLLEKYDRDEFGRITPTSGIEYIDDIEIDYDFMNEEIVSAKRNVDVLKVIPPDGLRFSIINILAYCISQMINEYMIEYTKLSNSYSDDKKCLIIMKNEFLFYSILLTMAKKNYASIQELQEGKISGKKLDIKGMSSLMKSTMNESTKKRLKAIVYDEILNTTSIDQINILKKLAILEKDIYNSLESGSKDFYKPVVIKSIDNYENPMIIQGIKASVAYNELKEDNYDIIDLNKRNPIDIVKVDISFKNIDLIKESYPYIYDKLVPLLESSDFNKGISSVAIPYGVDVPSWIIPFIDYVTIINDNISGFPLENVGLYFSDKTNSNYTNILQI